MNINRVSKNTNKFTIQPDSLPLFKPVANIAISKILNMSTSLAHLLKEKSIELKFIEVIKNFSPCNINNSGLNNKLARKHLPNLRYINGKYYLQGPDLVKTHLRWKKRKKIDPYTECHNRGKPFKKNKRLMKENTVGLATHNIMSC